ncbi:SURF1 family protein [Azospirillum doebereinerae]|uniref:SURF1-like protein n=1 Tax=Azospirillum doebereinerae TaxID=92933 RepID=A0A3S0WK00_9PROT|nr:SURF1 family protein [Azospirillum doebereinerae]MCG5239741.1 SURF1 family protein [Azospirillum doebereinerae]RUQ67135.1 SURF1 family protein [Azospirillum doebereinerae]
MTGPRRFRPSLTATLMTVPAVAIMLGLGTWQIQRMGWKAELMERVEQRVTAAPVPLPAVLDDPAAWEFRPVTLTGRFLNDQELLLIARPRQGQAGYEVMTPFARADGGGVVLVNRGFVPMDRRDPASRAGTRIDGDITLRGIVRLPQMAGMFQPDNRPGAETWLRADPPAMAATLKLDAVASFLVEALPGQSPGGLPAGIEPRVELPNNHLQYALTWYGLAATLAAIYVLSQRRSADTGRNGPTA